VFDERDLVERMRRGDQRAFDEFFDTYAPRLSAFAMRRSSLDPAAIEDVVQMTMINAMRKLGSFQGSAALFTWLCRICRNQIADVRRNAARRPNAQSLDDLALERPLATVVEFMDFRDPLAECESDSARGAVRRVVNSLPGHYARILEMRFGDEMSGQEIARALQMSEGAAESLLARARHAFKSAWAAHLQREPGDAGSSLGGSS
jgi:RNA polymerase sigma-70 factor (ECF subfamily)